ncbi:conserved hypothetical protein [Vibrio nigripulchritudo MADA3029]|uniref:DUF3545 domain-containing protein n=2 Tax=Vibrio nigripulchritudo TaxID=28173 RepID=U4KCL2_9VIBR|nr:MULTISPECIES: DUF3545 family protein [Vibrio]EGU61892.1 hypothetical protein VINI7043_28760 [Vibrio nigripulchritudo ATCC 27043]KJY72503.1 hypothetical protein TW74_22135 [Vibrio nigripulchritudo]UAB70898.1 DUF3545 family protein [Vibrio sp. SCSIO 43132]CCN33584.1 conserved hypothetical protein [Vibrio nigripulchritudo AM115]CCN44713.1 conserved hypothetical protein [Vibrio nigripulchritudo FTn2]
MDGFQLEDIMAMDGQQTRSTRSKPAKRKWREIEAIKDRQRLQRELMEMDVCNEYDLDDIDL